MRERVKTATKKFGKNKNDSVYRKYRNKYSKFKDFPVENILHLQGTAGNQAVKQLIKSRDIQSKLTIGKRNDKYEQEADRMAEMVMQMPDSIVQQQAEEEEKEEELQTKPLTGQITPMVQRQVEEEEEKEEEETLQAKEHTGKTSEVTPELETRIQSLKSGGQPLSLSARDFFEPQLRCNLSHVRVHSDARAKKTAQAIRARAFTVGRDVIFGAGQYSPETISGKKLLAHELVHVVQQKSPDSIGNHNVKAVLRGLTTANSVLEKGLLGSTLQRKEEKEPIAEEAEKITKRSHEIRWSRTSSGLVEVAKPGQRFLLMNFGINRTGLKDEHFEFLLNTVYHGTWAIDPMAKIKIIGHASKTGPAKFNLKLSRWRARRVAERLKRFGLPKHRIEEVRGKGFHEPIADNSSVYGRARNRRVEVLLIPWKPAKPTPEILTSLQKGMKPYVIKVNNFSSAPFQKTIKKIADEAFKPISVARIDWEGKASAYEGFVNFDNSTTGLKLFGMVGNVYLRSFKDEMICKREGDPSTCEKLFPHTSDILGRAIANTFCHEAAHGLGLDHVPTFGNYMWTPELHPLWEKKRLTYREKFLLGRKLQAMPSTFNGSQIVRMVHRIKEMRKARKKRPGLIEFH